MDLAADEPSAAVIPVQGSGFRCGGCFLALRLTQRSASRDGHDTRRDYA